MHVESVNTGSVGFPMKTNMGVRSTVCCGGREVFVKAGGFRSTSKTATGRQ